MAKHSNKNKYTPRVTPLNGKDHFLVTNYETKKTEHVELDTAKDFFGIEGDGDPTGNDVIRGNGILNGNVYWYGGLNYRSTPINFIFNGEEFTAPATNLVLQAADPTLDRIDVFVVNTNREVVVKTGTPAENPQEANVDFTAELRVSSVFIQAGSTEPIDVGLEQIYNENTGEPNEWSGQYNTLVGSIPTTNPIVLDSVAFPSKGSYCIEGTDVPKASNLTFENDAEIELTNIASLAFDFLSKIPFNYAVTIRILRGNTELRNITIRNNQYGLSGTQDRSYSGVNIPIKDFLSSNIVDEVSQKFDKIVFNFDKNNLTKSAEIVDEAPETLPSFYMDDVRLIYGEDTSTPEGTFLGLNDVEESSYSGKQGQFPSVNKTETGIEFKQIVSKTSDLQDKLISGSVYWTRNGLAFQSTPIDYVLQGKRRIAPIKSVTLSPADATNPRIDVFVVGLDNELTVIEGTPAASPQEPTIDFAGEIRVSSVLVNANETEPAGVDSELVYGENTGEPNEWTASSRGVKGSLVQSSEVEFDNTEDPKTGSTSIKVNQISQTTVMSFLNDTALTVEEVSSLSFALKRVLTKENSPFSVGIKIYNGTSLVASAVINDGQDGLDSRETSNYSIVNVPSSRFLRFTRTSSFDKIEFTFTNTQSDRDSKALPPSFYMDDVVLLKGEEVQPSDNSFLALNDVNEDTFQGNQGKVPIVNTEEDGLEFGDFPSGSTGLEAINEGSGFGYRLTGKDPANYGNAGLNSVDFGISNSASSDVGSTAEATFTVGLETQNDSPYTAAFGLQHVINKDGTSSGTNFITGYYANIFNQTYGSASFGLEQTLGTSGSTGGSSNPVCYYSIVGGRNNVMYAGRSSAMFGAALLSGSGGCMTIGVANVDLTAVPATALQSTLDNGNNPVFVIGNGDYNTATETATRSNAMYVLHNGDVNFPSLTNANIDAMDGFSAVTKQWVLAQPVNLEGYSETGTRAGSDLISTLGDFDGSGNGTFIRVDDANNVINISANKNLKFIDGFSQDFGILIGQSRITYGFELSGGTITNTGNYSFVIGEAVNDFGFENVSNTGNYNIVSLRGGSVGNGQHIIAVGSRATIPDNCSNSAVFGSSAVLTSSTQMALHSGNGGTISNNSTAHFGFSNFARGLSEMSIGHFGTDYTAGGNTQNPAETDRLFNIGNGVNGGARSDAFTVFKNGAALFHPMEEADITNATAGMMYYDNTTNKLRCYNGSTWNDLF